jgi:hypothetical protein
MFFALILAIIIDVTTHLRMAAGSITAHAWQSIPVPLPLLHLLQYYRRPGFTPDTSSSTTHVPARTYQDASTSTSNYCETCRLERSDFHDHIKTQKASQKEAPKLITLADVLDGSASLASLQYPAFLGDLMLKKAHAEILQFVHSPSLQGLECEATMSAYASNTLHLPYPSRRKLAQALEALFYFDPSYLDAYLIHHKYL